MQNIFGNEAVTSLLLRLIRSPQVLRDVVGLITVEQFRSDELLQRLLWESMQACLQYRGGVDYTSLRDMVLAVSRTYPGLNEHALNYLIGVDPRNPGLIYYAFHIMPVQEIEDRFTRKLVREFLHERYVFATLKAAMQHEDMTPANLPDLLYDAVARDQRVTQVDVNPITPAVSLDWAPKPVHVESTLIPFIDVCMDGGHAAGEVNGLLGPMGVGKTMLATMLAVTTAAMQLRHNMVDPSRPPKRVYFVTYEMSRDEIMHRMVSYAARINLTDLMRISSWDELTRAERNNLKEYEIADHRAMYGPPTAETPPLLGEYDRLQQVLPLLHDVIQIIDLSGTTTSARRGDGGVAEVAALIAQDQQAHGSPGVGCVLIDYVLLAVSRQAESQGLDPSRVLRFLIQRYVDAAKQQIAGAFQTPVWLLHQLNNDGNKGDPTKPTSHTQAAEGALFAAACVFVACFGTKDPETNCCLLNFSKRRRAGDYVPPRIIHINGAMATMEAPENEYMLDYRLRRIVRMDDVQTVHGGHRPGGTNYSNEVL